MDSGQDKDGGTEASEETDKDAEDDHKQDDKKDGWGAGGFGGRTLKRDKIHEP